MTRLPPRAFWPLACFLALGAFWGAWAALLPQMREQVDASDAELGLAMLGAGAGALPAMLLTGRLWRRWNWRLLPLTAALYGLATLTPIFAAAPIQLAGALFLIGAGSGALDVAMNAAVSDVEASSGARLMYGAHALFSLSVLLGSVLTGLAREAGAAPAHVLVAVAAVLGIAAAGSLTAARARARAQAEPGTAPVPGAAAAGVPIRGAFAVLAALCATALLIEDAVQNWSALHLERTLLTGPAVGGAGPGVFAGAMFLGRASGQVLGARLSERALVAGGSVVSALGLAIVAVAPGALVALVGLALAGAGVALVAPALYARAGRLAGPADRGSAIATLTFFGYMGFLAGPVLMGNLAELAGLRIAFAGLGVLAVLLAAAGAVALERRGRKGVLARGAELLRTGRG